MHTALDEYLKGRKARTSEISIEEFERLYEGEEHRGNQIRTDAAAAALADTPMLTGDPEFDRLEMMETQNTSPIV